MRRKVESGNPLRTCVNAFGRVAVAGMPRPSSIALRASLLVGTLVVLVLLLPASAGAHAHLLFSSPADGAVVEVAPDEVQLEFGAQVTATVGSIQVFAPDGSRVDEGAPSPAKGTRVGQPITATEDGTYGVAYRLSSEDGHVLTDSFTFVVGEASGGSAAADDARDAAKVDPTLDTAFSVARFIELLALLLAAGGGLFACLIAPTWRPRWLA
ncbi:MAG: copper resistance protein CopC, partial [Thermoleophilia bacterium]|nr:copper resistance protein CopC [Thermoleophilia bacterium]